MINVLFYIPRLGRRQGGVYQYSCTLLKMLKQLDQREFKVFVYNLTNDKFIQEIITGDNCLELLTYELSDKYLKKNRIKGLINRVSNKIIKKELFNVLSLDAAIANKYNIDIFHYPTQEYTKIENVKCITTLHDVQELYFPEYFTAIERAQRATNYLNATNSSNKIIVSFNHVKEDIIRFFQKSPNDIEVLLINMKDLWFEKFCDDDILDLKELNLPNKFLLYPAACWEHKNHTILIEAIKKIKEEKNQIVNLICTGSTKHYYPKLEALVKEYDLGNEVKFLGIVSEEILYSLYKKCTGIVIPTKYEAGSFPLIEAMLLGIPVICSSVTSLPETIGNTNYVFDPDNVDEVVELLLKIYNDEVFRTKNRENSFVNKDRLINDDAYLIVDKIYKELAS